MQEQRILLRRCSSKIPDLMLSERLGLRCNLEPFIIGDKHLIGGLTPVFHLIVSYAKLTRSSRMALHGIRSRTQIMLRHKVCIDIIVSDSTVLVRTSDSI